MVKNDAKQSSHRIGKGKGGKGGKSGKGRKGGKKCIPTAGKGTPTTGKGNTGKKRSSKATTDSVDKRAKTK